MLLLEFFCTFYVFSVISLYVFEMLSFHLYKTLEYRLFMVYLLILFVYCVFIREGCGDALPGVFTQYFFVIARYEKFRWLSTRGSLFSILLHLSLTGRIGFENIICLTFLITTYLLLIDFRERRVGLVLPPFTLLFLLLDPRLAFWGLCLSVFFSTLHSLDFLVGKRREGAPQALAFGSVFLLFLTYFLFILDHESEVFKNLLTFFEVPTLMQLSFLCALPLIAGACVIFAIIHEKGEKSTALVALFCYLLVCMALGLFCLIFRQAEIRIWSQDVFFIITSISFYLLSTFIVGKPMSQTLPLFFAGMALYYGRFYVLLSPGMQSWLLGFGGLTLLVWGTKTLFIDHT